MKRKSHTDLGKLSSGLAKYLQRFYTPDTGCLSLIRLLDHLPDDPTPESLESLKRVLSCYGVSRVFPKSMHGVSLPILHRFCVAKRGSDRTLSHDDVSELVRELEAAGCGFQVCAASKVCNLLSYRLRGSVAAEDGFDGIVPIYDSNIAVGIGKIVKKGKGDYNEDFCAEWNRLFRGETGLNISDISSANIPSEVVDLLKCAGVKESKGGNERANFIWFLVRAFDWYKTEDGKRTKKVRIKK